MDLKLKEYIDNHILNHVDYRRKYDEETGNEFYLSTIELAIIERQIPEDEIPIAFEYLKSKDIYVIGNSKTLYIDFDNYIYSNRGKSPITLPPSMSKNEFDIVMKKYKECSDLEEKKLLRNKLIEGNLRLVNKVIIGCYRYCELDKEELESYGYEGLIKAIDNYSNDKYTFSTFAIPYIDGYIKKGLGKIRKVTGRNFFTRYLNCKKSLEIELGYMIKNDEELDYLDDIIDIYMETYASSTDTKENLKRKIYLSKFLKLDDIELLEEDFSDKKVEEVFLEGVSKDIEDSLEYLPENLKMAIYHYYELDSSKKAKYDGIIKECGYDTSYLRKARRRAFNILKQKECLKKDLEEFGVSPSDKKKKQKTKRKTWNNVIYMV